jgi:hypothetical protein
MTTGVHGHDDWWAEPPRARGPVALLARGPLGGLFNWNDAAGLTVTSNRQHRGSSQKSIVSRGDPA